MFFNIPQDTTKTRDALFYYLKTLSLKLQMILES